VPGCSGTGAYAFLGNPGGGNGNGPNYASGAYSVVGGGSSNEACDNWAIVVGGYGNAVSSGSTNTAGGFIGGGNYNVLTGNDSDSAIVAGGNNDVSNAESAIVGGYQNTVSAALAFMGGGYANTLSAEDGAIAGGTNNTVSGVGGYVGAGGYNTASGEGSVIGGGYNSTAAGAFATIPGGYVDSAAGTYSFAAGARASAAHTGTFVWSDGSDGDAILSSSHPYQFVARASGGVTFWTNRGSTVGATLAPGSGTWSSASDRNLKTDVAPLDDAAVLDKVAALPISRWSYKTEHGVRHVGPMAQDFYAAFKVGEDDRHITSIDEDGVALAAIKALHAENRGLHAENAALRRTITAMRAAESAHDRRVDAELARLEARSR